MSNLAHQLNKLNLQLPSAPRPVGNYKATLKTGNILYISGQLPIINGDVIYQGTLGKDLSVAEGEKAAEICALNILSQLNIYLKNDTLVQLIKVEGYINAIHAFEHHAKVLDGASDLFKTVLGEKSGHIRTVIGCTSLPLNVPVEISVIAELES